MVQITEVRNARSMNLENTHFDVEINHPDYGWIPYMLTPWDTDTTIDNSELLSLIGSDFVAFSQEDADQRKSDEVRHIRNQRLIHEVDPIVTNSLRWGDLSAQEKADVSAYRLALLDVPSQSGFPYTISWPTKPTCL